MRRRYGSQHAQRWSGLCLVLLTSMPSCEIDPGRVLHAADAGVDASTAQGPGPHGSATSNATVSGLGEQGSGESTTNGDEDGAGESESPGHSGTTATPPAIGHSDECVPSDNNLVDNSDFADDIDGWAVPPGDKTVTELHDSRSFDGAEGSGALSLHLDMSGNGATPGFGRVISGAVQCLPVSADVDYHVAASYWIDRGEGDTTTSLSVFQYASDDCSGEFSAVWSSAEGTLKGEWAYLLGEFHSRQGVHTAALRLNVASTATYSSELVLYDEVYLSTETLCGESGAGSMASDPPPPKDEDEPATGKVDGGRDEMTADDSESKPEPEPATGETEVTEAPTETEPEPTTDLPATDTTTEETVSAPSYAETVESIFLAKCVNACHQQDGLGGPGATAAIFGALDLSQGAGYASLVNGDSEQVDLALVGPTLEESYLWYKLLGTQADVGSSETKLMPYGLDPLDAAEIEAVESWILGGAVP